MLFLLIFLMLWVTEVDGSIQECQQAFKQGKYTQALISCEQQLPQDGSEPLPELLILLTQINTELDNKPKAQEYLEKLKNHAEFNKQPRYRYFWHRKKGIHYFHLNEFERAREQFNHALSLAIMADQLDWLAQSHNDFGVLTNKLKDFKAALAHYDKSLDISQQLNDQYQVGKLYNNIGTVHKRLEDYDNAIKYHQLALKTFDEINQVEETYNAQLAKKIRHAHESLLQLYLLTDDRINAEKEVQNIISNDTEQIIARERIPSMINFVRVYIQEQQYELAEFFLKKSIELSRQSEQYFMPEIRYQFAQLYQNQGQFKQAIVSLDSGIEYLDEDDYINLAKFYLLLSQLYEKNEGDQALLFLKKYQFYREKFLKQEYDSGINAIKHVIEKKQFEHELSLKKLDLISKDLKLKSLSNYFLWVTIVVIVLATFLIVLYVSKKRERRFFLKKINNHKQQLILLNDQLPADVDVSVSKEDFCKHLVETMTEVIDVWEKHTGNNRIEFADRSGIWTVSNDDGTLRTRSLDKYLSIERIPKNPRWRNVVRSCHFVLSDEKISKAARESLEKKLSMILSLFQKLSS